MLPKSRTDLNLNHGRNECLPSGDGIRLRISEPRGVKEPSTLQRFELHAAVIQFSFGWFFIIGFLAFAA